MSLISSLLQSAVGNPAEIILAPINAVGNILDKLFTSDDERLSKQVLLERLRMKPLLAQQEINKIEAGHRSVFVAGWRPFLGWLCGLGYFYEIILRPILLNFGVNLVGLDKTTIISITVALLGLSAERTVEKVKKISR